MRLILDTNVLVSSLIQRNYPYLIVDRILADSTLQLCISEQVFTEYVEVLNREKFSKFPDFLFRAQALLADLKSQAKDLVIGNKSDFIMNEHKGTKIVSPKEFYELLNK